ncbi:hypothetical protein BGW41_004693 [Actinomortierella wolfii]|nr:hypothetical protein BGW41_004693 [Actinomortierella wolfii]
MDSWKAVYRSRHEKDRIVNLLLDEIIQESRGRIMHMEGIVRVGVIEARDVLEKIVQARPQSSTSSTITPVAGISDQATETVKTDLTRSYYARKILRMLSREWVLQQWRQYRLQELNFPIWQGCVLIAMFSDHELEPSQVDRQFQELADEFLMTSPMPENDMHQSYTQSVSVHHTTSLDNVDTISSGAQSGQSSSTHIDSDREMRRWEEQTERFKALVRFFTETKNFRGNTENYYDPLNSYIHCVLERRIGIPISLCVVFAELASRVGFHNVELMGFPQHFMIRFQPDRTPTAPSFLSSPHTLPTEQMDPPVYYLDLFNPLHQLIAKAELRDYFTGLNITLPLPSGGYNLPATPIEVFLRFLRNIYFAIGHAGGAGRLTSDNKMKLYSAMTQLLVLHPGEECDFYLLWLKYLSENWPEDIGFVRAAIVETEALDLRRSMARYAIQARKKSGQQSQKPQYTIGYSQAAGLQSRYTSSSSASQTIIRFMQSHVRELEVYDDMGEVGEIRRRRRSKVKQTLYIPTTTATASPPAATSTTEGITSAQATSPSNTAISATSVAEDTTLATDPQASPVPGPVQPDANGDGSSFGARGLPSPGSSNDPRRSEPLYYVGEVFRHRFYRYMGVICGYDLHCEAEESWIVTMGVDSLPLGRNQPFYHALLVDGTRTYVAQENVQVLFRDLNRRNRDKRRPSLLRKVSSTTTASPTTVEGEPSSQSSWPRDLGPSARQNTDLEGQWPSSPSRHTNVHPEQNSALVGESHRVQDSPASIVDDDHHLQQPERGDATSSSSSSSSVVAEGQGLGLSFPSDISLPASAGQVSHGEPASGSNDGENATPDPSTNGTPLQGATDATYTAASAQSDGTEILHEIRYSDLGPMGTEEVGKYFEAWDGENGHYIMNKELRRRYPTEDYLW